MRQVARLPIAEERAEAGAWLAWFATPSRIGLLIGLYLGGHFVLRLLLGPTLGIDDAEQALFAQQWAWGYRFRQPPLFTWLLQAVIPLVGVNVLAISIVRYALLGLTYLCLYLTARRWIKDQRLAGLTVLSLPQIYVFAYYAHHDLTHTTALSAAIAASFYAFARLAERPSVAAYGLLGLCFGLGMLAKWNFVMLALGLPLTCLVVPGFRQLVLTWRSLVAVLVAALIVAPTGLWMFANGQTVAVVSGDILTAAAPVSEAGWGALLLGGSGALLKSTVLFPLPFLVIFLMLFGRQLRAAFGRPAPAGSAVTAGFVGALIGLTLLLHWLLIPLFGAATFSERWMHPALMILPVWLFQLLDRAPPSQRAILVYGTVTVLLVAAVFGARLYRYAQGADSCGKCRDLVPFAELADGLRAAGFERGTIVADGMHIGGNLRVAFPDSRIIDPAFPLDLWPPASGRGMCLAVWQAETPTAEARAGMLRDFVAERLGIAREVPRERGQIDALMLNAATRRYALGYELIREGQQGGCR